MARPKLGHEKQFTAHIGCRVRQELKDTLDKMARGDKAPADIYREALEAHANKGRGRK
jgi:predicted DNA-binding protein